MKQYEAVRLALHLLSGKAKLDKITLLALMFKNVDWSGTETPNASIRRIVRQDEFIHPINGEIGCYELIKPLPEELISQNQLRDDWEEIVIGYRKMKDRLDELTQALALSEKNFTDLHDKLLFATAELANSLPLKQIVEYSINHFNTTQQQSIKLMIYELYAQKLTIEQIKILEPLGLKEPTIKIDHANDVITAGGIKHVTQQL